MSFPLFGPAHWTALGMIVLLPIAAALLVRENQTAARHTAWGFAALLLLNKVLVAVLAWHGGKLSWQEGLPMHLCDWATGVVILLAVWPRRRLFEVAYYWGLAGTLQALLTPDLPFGFEDIGAWTFFISHGGVISGVIFFAAVHRFELTAGSILRALAWSQVYFAVTLLVNWLLGANYGYLCAKPLRPSLLDHLGPWPWYWLSLEALAVVSFTLYWALYRGVARLVFRGAG